jgi:hypothetical protein
MFRRFPWRWEQVSPFAKTGLPTDKTRVDAISFTTPQEGASRPHPLPAGWGLPLEDVVALLNRDCTKWGN